MKTFFMHELTSIFYFFNRVSHLLEKKYPAVFWLHKKEVGNMLSSLKKLRDADFATLSLPFHSTYQTGGHF